MLIGLASALSRINDHLHSLILEVDQSGNVSFCLLESFEATPYEFMEILKATQLHIIRLYSQGLLTTD